MKTNEQENDTPETDGHMKTLPYNWDYFDYQTEVKMKEMEQDRDYWKKRFEDLDRELMCELRDPNGTIWEHARNLQKERDALKEALIEMRYGHTDKAERMAAEILGEEVTPS